MNKIESGIMIRRGKINDKINISSFSFFESTDEKNLIILC